MKRIILDMFVMGFIGGLVGGGIKFFQWIGADLTFGILVTMPAANSILPMILKVAGVGMAIGLIIGIYELLVADKTNYDLSENRINRKLYDNRQYTNESIDEEEDKSEEGLIWKKEQYMDVLGVWGKLEDDYIDASGAWRRPGDDYIDASGAWRRPGDDYIDASGAWRRPGDDYIDASGAWRRPGDDYIDASGAWRKP